MRDCTCLGTCRGAEGLASGWRCALEPDAAMNTTTGGGHQRERDLRGDPGAPRGQTDDTRDKVSSESSPAGEAMQVANISGASHLSDRAEAAEQQVKEP